MTRSPSRNDPVTARACLNCRGPLNPKALRYCSDRCRQAGWRRRHQDDQPVVLLPGRHSRREGTIYTCPECETRYLAEQWCPDCNRPCQRTGAGGTCPACDELITAEELLADDARHLPTP